MRKFFGIITLLVGIAIAVLFSYAMIDGFNEESVVLGIPIILIGFIVAFTGMRVLNK